MRNNLTTGLCLFLLASLVGCAGSKGLYHDNRAWSVKEQWHKHDGRGTMGHHLNMTPCVASGKVIVGDYSGLVQLYDPKHGHRLWHKQMPHSITASLTANRQQIFVAGGHGFVTALDIHTGKRLWQKRVLGEVLARPVIAQDKLLVKTENDHLYMLDARDGHLIWHYQGEMPSLILRGSSMPVVSGGSVVAGFASGELISFTLADGDIQWKRRVSEPQGITSMERMVDIDAAPVIRDDHVYWVNYQGAVGAYALSTGETLWQAPASSYTGLAVDDQHLYLTDDKQHLLAYDRKDGTLAWQQTGFDRGVLLTAPVLVGNSLVVADKRGYVHWLDKATGLSQTSLKVTVHGGMTSPVIAMGEQVMVHTDEGELFAFRADKS
jgi:outer membrane protein assembly factor BamB